ARIAQYAYRPGGDRTRVSQGGRATDYQYVADRLVKVGDDELAYDACGNLIKRTGPSGAAQFQYDVEGRLTGAPNSQGAQIAYAFDAIGERVARRDTRGTTFFLQFGRNVVEELDESGAPQAFYVHGPGIDHPLAMLRDGKIYFYHADAQGNIALLTDSNGKIAASYETDA